MRPLHTGPRGSISAWSNMPSISLRPRCFPATVLLLAIAASSNGLARDSEPKWIRVSSAHFSVLTDAGEKKGRETSLRLEQMRDSLCASSS